MRPLVLIKFMDEKNVDSFIKEGLLYMNAICYFKKKEDSMIRGDKYEGISSSYRSDQVVVEINGKEIKGISGKINIHGGSDSNTNIYSMAVLTDKDFMNGNEVRLSEKFIEFGNKAVFISGGNINIFFEKIKMAMDKDINLSPVEDNQILARHVSYVEESHHHDSLGIFNKFNQYSWQREWRVAIDNNGSSFFETDEKNALKLKIGNISNICSIYNTEDIIGSPLRITQNSIY